MSASESRQMTEIIAVRFTEADLSKIDNAADYFGIGRSELIRRAVLVHIQDVPKWWREARERARKGQS